MIWQQSDGGNWQNPSHASRMRRKMKCCSFPVVPSSFLRLKDNNNFIQWEKSFIALLIYKSWFPIDSGPADSCHHFITLQSLNQARAMIALERCRQADHYNAASMLRFEVSGSLLTSSELSDSEVSASRNGKAFSSELLKTIISFYLFILFLFAISSPYFDTFHFTRFLLFLKNFFFPPLCFCCYWFSHSSISFAPWDADLWTAGWCQQEMCIHCSWAVYLPLSGCLAVSVAGAGGPLSAGDGAPGFWACHEGWMASSLHQKKISLTKGKIPADLSLEMILWGVRAGRKALFTLPWIWYMTVAFIFSSRSILHPAEPNRSRK